MTAQAPPPSRLLLLLETTGQLILQGEGSEWGGSCDLLGLCDLLGSCDPTYHEVLVEALEIVAIALCWDWTAATSGTM